MDHDLSYVVDIIEAASLALSYVEGQTEERFVADIQCQDSVIRRLEIIGEAARRISGNFRSLHSELPWSDMIGMRNILIHDYDDVDIPLVWKTVINELPVILAKLQRILDAAWDGASDAATPQEA